MRRVEAPPSGDWTDWCTCGVYTALLCQSCRGNHADHHHYLLEEGHDRGQQPQQVRAGGRAGGLHCQVSDHQELQGSGQRWVGGWVGMPVTAETARI